MRFRYLAVLLVLAAVWGSSFLFIKIGVAEMHPVTLVATRLVVGATILLVVLYGRGLRLPTEARTWVDLLVVGVTGLIIPYVLITWGEQFIDSNLAAILNATVPLFSVLLTYIWTRDEQWNSLKLAGILVGFAGVMVAVGIGAINGDRASLEGDIAILVASFFYAIAGIYGRRAFRGMPALVPATGQLVSGAVLITPVALLGWGIPDPLPSSIAIGAVLALGVLGTSVAYILLYWLMERIGATRTSMVTYLLPPFAIVYGAVFLDEAISRNAILGLGLVIVGILLANGVLRLDLPARLTRRVS
jgi:drug/metabolite transporter (DMT)-like permease